MPPIQAKTVASFAKKLLFAAKQKLPLNEHKIKLRSSDTVRRCFAATAERLLMRINGAGTANSDFLEKQ